MIFENRRPLILKVLSMTVVYDYFGNVVAQSATYNDIITPASAVHGVINGTAGADLFQLGGTGGHIVIGNGGNDVFYGITSTDILTEPTNYTGLATAYVQSNYVMYPWMTNMVVMWATAGVYGNAKNNYIVSNVQNISIDGGTGNDVMTGSAGDSFRFDANSGYDVITNFQPGARTSISVTPETVQLAGYLSFRTFAQVQAAMTQVGANVILKLDANDAIEFLNTKISAFTADNFLLDSTPSASSLKMTFDDEFSNGVLSASTGGLQTLWRTDYGWGNNANATMAHTLTGTGEQEIFVDPTMVSLVNNQQVTINPFSFQNGSLVIHAAPTPTADLTELSGYKYTSGMISTRDSFTQTYGYFSASMKLPSGGGAWPAFWLYSVSGGAEIDIMESHGPDTWTATTHSFATGTEISAGSTIYTPYMSNGYHTFSLLWTATSITWFLDGTAVRSVATPADMNGPMYMMLGMAMDSTTTSSFTGADMDIAWVRAYSLNNMPASVVTASNGVATLNDLNGATTLIGGTGDDTFYVSRTSTQVVDSDAAGNNIVYSSVNYVLPTNVKKLYLTGTATTATSNSVGGTLFANNLGDTLISTTGNDTLVGGTGNDTLVVGSGKDILTGGGGSDIFRFGALVGQDLITDYNTSKDSLDLTALAGHAFTLNDTNGGTMMTITGDGSVFFSGVSSAALAASSGFAPATLSHNAYNYSGTF
jgi:serralysin